MIEKLKKIQELWSDTVDDPTNIERRSGEIFDFSKFDSLKHFESEHPVVMNKRIEEKNWQIDLDISKTKFTTKEKLMYWYERLTGKRLFDFRNYKII